MSTKLSKKELKSPDAFQTTFEKFSDYVSENRTRVTIIGIALVCAVVVALGIYSYWSYYSGSALKLYTRAQENILKGGDNKEAMNSNIAIYKELIEKYPYSWSGRMAYYHLGNIYYNSGEMEPAIRTYEKFVAKAGADKTGIKFLALTSLGYAYEVKKDFKQALKYFEQAQNVYSVGFETIGFRNIARAHEELNNKEKALEYYKKALDKTTDPGATLIIKRKIATLS